MEFDDTRQALIKECDEIMKFNFSDQTLSFGIWPECMGQKSNKDIINDYESSAFMSDSQHRETIRSLSSDHFQIFYAVVARLQLIQTSCSRISSSWSGISSEINEFRYLLERYAALIDLFNKFEEETGTLQIKNLTDLENFSNLVANSGWTRFNWTNIDTFAFEDMKGTTYKHNEDSNKVDLNSKNIMSCIDRVAKKDMRGLRAFYSFCCEFVHSNLGDAVSCAFSCTYEKAQDGIQLERYLLSPLSKPIFWRGEGSYFVETALICSSYIFATKMLGDLNRRIPSMLKLINQAKRINSKWIHKTVKRTGAFDKNDLCPCGSGFSIKSCIAKSGRLELVR